MALSAQSIVLAARPQGLPRPSDFAFVTDVLPEPGPGEVALQMLWLSLDPYMRRWMSEGPGPGADRPLGQAPPCEGVARVIASHSPALAEGDIVLVADCWRDHAVKPAALCRKLDPALAPVQTALGVLGMPGFTAWGGLAEIGRPRPGETLVVGAASGAVGGLVGQIARLRGARVVGVAGGEAKCAWAKEELGFDACLDRHAPDLAEALARACPRGVDVYFELTGGAVFDAVLPLLNPFARVPVCGTIAGYNGLAPSAGPDRLALLMRKIHFGQWTFRGFNIDNLGADRAAFEAEMAAWLAEGAIKYREDVHAGLAAMPQAFIGLLQGANFGKVLIRLAA